MHLYLASSIFMVLKCEYAQYFQDPSKFGARDSLVRQASIDRLQNEGIRRCSTLKHRKELEQQLHAVRVS